MIKNCLRSEKDFYRYDITHNGEKIATAHLLSIRDKSVVFTSREDNLYIDNTHNMIIKALDDWEFADKNGAKLPITMQTLDDLQDEYYLALVNAIKDHEIAVMDEAKEIEKN